MINERVRLSVGAVGAQRVIGVVAGLVFVAGGTAFAVLPALASRWMTGFGGQAGGGECTVEGGTVDDLPPGLLEELGCSRSSSPFDWFEPVQLIGLLGLPFVVLGLGLVLRVLRSAVWLEGTHADVRGAVRTRRVDLSTAEITAGAVEQGSGHNRVRIPVLVARDPATGRRVTISLRGNAGGYLPPDELRALADAITRNRPGDGGRHGDAHAMARQLRERAERPLAI
ncbi:hypothetical protein [Spirilliplanes yamanashiensis]|uniref:hypothetical protein n=1 Tax=Spirilliplanes yamanashiensis TaxID=42233 RepID=UPI0019513949|nr:hypothetical protein [Spirilliplanes yamanashiensis]MDP9819904.1 hypothetical protein [Spirilliplanes yamanashiensis]